MEEEYLRPDYSEEEEFPYDSIGPSDDDDEDDIDDDDGEFEDLDDYDPNRTQEEEEKEDRIEQLLNQQNNKKMQTSGAFNNSGGGSWGNNNGTTTNSSPWGNNNNGVNNNTGSSWNSSSWQRTTSTPWGGNNNGGGTSTPWGNSGSGWNSSGNSNNGNGKQELDRAKKVIFCDILDCLVETFQSNGRPGLLPRGIYDIRLRFEVWDKLGMFSPERIYAMVPRCLLNSSNGSDSWRVMLEYIICSLSEYLRLPYVNCQVLTQTTIGQPKEEMIESVLSGGRFKIPKESVVQIGIESGLYGQNNRDKIAAEKCGIDYIDLGQLMTIYW